MENEEESFKGVVNTSSGSNLSHDKIYKIFTTNMICFDIYKRKIVYKNKPISPFKLYALISSEVEVNFMVLATVKAFPVNYKPVPPIKIKPKGNWLENIWLEYKKRYCLYQNEINSNFETLSELLLMQKYIEYMSFSLIEKKMQSTNNVEATGWLYHPVKDQIRDMKLSKYV